MANQIPFTGSTNAGGGYLLPPEQGEILVNGILVETGAIQLAGDKRSTTARKTNFPIWLGRPIAGMVGEGAAKPLTGASFGQGSLNIRKIASIVVFTDEQIADLQNGDLSVLVDAGVRQSISVAADANGVGASAGSSRAIGKLGETAFDNALLAKCAQGVQIGTAYESVSKITEATNVQKGVSAALSLLEENGYGNPDDIGVLLGFGFQKVLRDARDGFGRPLYDGGSFAGQTIDPLYGLDRAHSTNLVSITSAQPTIKKVSLTSASKVVEIKERVEKTGSNYAPIVPGQPIKGEKIPAGATVVKVTEYESGHENSPGYEKKIEISAAAEETKEITNCELSRPAGVVLHKPNLHVRVREDVVVKTSNEASITMTNTGEEGGGTEAVSLFQNNLTAVLYETRIGYFIHDSERAVVPLFV